MNVDKAIPLYQRTVFLVAIVIAGMTTWFVIAQWWGFVAVRNDQGNSVWSPALLGDSFGFLNAILTAAAFIAVVMTYRKEQEQLRMLREEKVTRAIEWNQQLEKWKEEKNERERAAIDQLNRWMDEDRAREEQQKRLAFIEMLNYILRNMNDRYERIAERADGLNSPDDWVIKVIKSDIDFFSPLNTWCKRALEESAPLSQFDRSFLSEMLYALLPANVITVLIEMSKSPFPPESLAVSSLTDFTMRYGVNQRPNTAP